jgi:hypothetical protein
MGTIRAQPLDGVWETLGNGLFAGIRPSNIRPSWGINGPETMSFDLNIDPKVPSLALAEFTPIEYEGDGLDPAWAGYVTDAPASTSGLSVTCAGWHHALEFQRRPLMYVHTDLSAFQDVRGLLSGDLDMHRASMQVSTDGGIVLSFPEGTPAAPNTGVAVVADLGPGSPGAIRVVLEVQSSFNFGGVQFYATATNREDYISGVPLSPSIPKVATFLSGTTANPHRYITFLMFSSVGPGTWGGDAWVRIRRAMLFANTAYESGNGSVLKASTVFTAELAKNPFLRPETDRIFTTPTSIPTLGAAREQASTHEILDRVNGYHAYRWGVDQDRRLYFQPQPATPDLSVNTSDNGVTYTDASRNSGENEYNEVMVTAQSGAGVNLEVVRNMPGFPATAGFAQVQEPSFTVATTGWVATIGTVTRDTSVFDTAPASGRANADGVGRFFAHAGTVTQPLQAGRRYRVYFRFNPTAGLDSMTVAVSNGSVVRGGPWIVPRTALTVGQFNTVFYDWTQPVNDTQYRIQFDMRGQLANAILGYFDELQIGPSVATLLDRRGLTRTLELQSQTSMDEITMAIVGNLRLTQTSRPLMKGGLTLSAPVVWETLSGRRLKPAEVASRAGEMIRLADIEDPYTGQTGRDVLMVNAVLSDSNSTVEISLDADRGSFDALMSRFGVL